MMTRRIFLRFLTAIGITAAVPSIAKAVSSDSQVRVAEDFKFLGVSQVDRVEPRKIIDKFWIVPFTTETMYPRELQEGPIMGLHVITKHPGNPPVIIKNRFYGEFITDLKCSILCRQFGIIEKYVNSTEDIFFRSITNSIEKELGITLSSEEFLSIIQMMRPKLEDLLLSRETPKTTRIREFQLPKHMIPKKATDSVGDL